MAICTYFDNIDDALIAGLSQNQDFFTLLLQNDEIKKEEKAGNLTEDDVKDELEEIQKLTDDCMKDIDKMIANKEKELMEL